MKLKKEDYMRLPKERLAELLVEMQEEQIITAPNTTPIPYTPPPSIPWYPWGSPVITYTTAGKNVEELK